MPAMTASNLPSEASVCIAQAERLQAIGATCRNTFIDFPLSRHSVQRRIRSSPPSSRRPCTISTCDSSTQHVEATKEALQNIPKRPRWSDAVEDDEEDESFSERNESSSASTACSESEQYQNAPRVSKAGVVGRTSAVEDLAALVERDCGFLRIQSYSVQVQSKTGKRSSNLSTLRFFVQGLPFAKRAKWMQPLLWSITAILARSNVEATVKGGELLAMLADGLTIRIDFAAARM